MSAPRLARRSRSASLWADAAATPSSPQRRPTTSGARAPSPRAPPPPRSAAPRGGLEGGGGGHLLAVLLHGAREVLAVRELRLHSWRLSSRPGRGVRVPRSRGGAAPSPPSRRRQTRFLPSTERSTTRAARIRVASTCASLRRAAFLSSSASASGVFGSGLTDASRRALTGKFSVSGDFCESGKLDGREVDAERGHDWVTACGRICWSWKASRRAPSCGVYHERRAAQLPPRQRMVLRPACASPAAAPPLSCAASSAPLDEDGCGAAVCAHSNRTRAVRDRFRHVRLLALVPGARRVRAAGAAIRGAPERPRAVEAARRRARHRHRAEAAAQTERDGRRAHVPDAAVHRQPAARPLDHAGGRLDAACPVQGRLGQPRRALRLRLPRRPAARCRAARARPRPPQGL